MIQEYLLIDENVKNKIETFQPENITKFIQKIDNAEAWFVSFSAIGENEDTAKKLSSVHDEFVSLCGTPIILTHGSSEYFNKKLFPLVNDFELKLRKLLYIYSTMHKGEKAASNIIELEKKDFGSLFEMLFTDDTFIKEAKIKANQTTWKYTKKELINIIKELEEKAVWDELLGKDTIPTLRNYFADIRAYRNDVMHAHYISYGAYLKARKLFDSVNQEINEKISTIIKKPESSKANEQGTSEIALSVTPHYNDILHSAMQILDKDGYLRPYNTVLPNELYRSDYQLFASPLITRDLIFEPVESVFKLSPNLQSELEMINKVKSNIAPVISELEELKETLTENEITIPKGIIDLQKDLNGWKTIEPSILSKKE